MKIGIGSFSFHRLLAAGKQDIFQYIVDCKELGCTQLDPWNAHLSDLRNGDSVIFAGRNPDSSQFLSAADEAYIDKVRAASDKAELPFGCIAVDGAHVYDENPIARTENRARAYRWLDVARKLGANQVRIDCGGSEELPDDELDLITQGYADLIARAGELGIEVLIENHWGPSVIPENVIKILGANPGLGFLFDTHNWRPDRKEEARRMCASYATATHIKTLAWDELGNETGENIAETILLLINAGYRGPWGVESVPPDGDEIQAARRSIELIRRTVQPC